MVQQVGRQMGAAIAFRQDTLVLWWMTPREEAICCGKNYRYFGWFNRHRRAKHREVTGVVGE